jgi:hypothetical protein
MLFGRSYACAQAENLVRASEQVSSLDAEISTQLQGARSASWLDIFRPRCSVAASNFGQVMRSRIFPTYSTLTPMTRGTTVKAFKLSTSDSLHIPIAVDTGASLSLTPFLDDFDNTPNKSELKELQAVSSATKVEGIGTVRWKVIDSAVHTLKTKAYYVPTAHIRLYSPQAHFRESSEGSLDLNLETLTLRFPNKVKLVFPINQAIAKPAPQHSVLPRVQGIQNILYQRASRPCTIELAHQAARSHRRTTSDQPASM